MSLIFAREGGYATPKLTCEEQCFDDTILLVREREDGCWTLPGGWADVGESQARLLFEKYMKNPVIIHATKLLAVYDRSTASTLVHHVYKLFSVRTRERLPVSQYRDG